MQRLLSLVVIASTTALVSGADWLGAVSPVGIPAGNLVAWAMLASLNALPVVLAMKIVPRAVAWTLLALAALWLPVSFLLFGNVYLSNAGPLALRIWLGYTALLVLAPLSLLVAALVRKAWKAE